MDESQRRELLTRLPLPLAQIYRRVQNAKDSKSRHDLAYFLLEAVVKLAACVQATAYLRDVAAGRPRAAAVDRELRNLAEPSFGQWVGLLRELARAHGEAEEPPSPLRHVCAQLSARHGGEDPIAKLNRRIANGVDGDARAGGGCTVLHLLDVIVQYRNEVLGHAAPRSESFYRDDLGPLLEEAAEALLAPGALDLLGPPGSRLALLCEIRGSGRAKFELGVRDLVGTVGTRSASLELDANEVAAYEPGRVAVLWPGHRLPLRLDPMLTHRDRELGEEVLFANSLGGAKRPPEYLGYTTGRIEREPDLAALAAELLAKAGAPSEPALAPQKPADVAPARGSRPTGDYEFLCEIGRGGMGVVHLARQRSLGRVVAIKVLPEGLEQDELALTRFRTEIRALGSCDHPNVVKLLDSGTLPDNRVYYTMEYIGGCDLDRVWRELSPSSRTRHPSELTGGSFADAVLSASGRRRQELVSAYERASGAPEPAAEGSGLHPPLPLPPLATPAGTAASHENYVRRIVALFVQAAGALQAVHDRKVVHRDVSPANLMLTPDAARIVLMDFGLAKSQSLSPGPTIGGGFVGKLRYAAPEQMAAAVAHVGPRADVRGLGVTLWEMLTRRRLFEDAGDERQLASMLLGRDVPRLREVDPLFDADIDAIVARATERSADDRIESAAKFGEYLQLYLDGKPLPIRPPSTAELVGRWVKRHRAVVAASAAALLYAVGATIVSFVMINRSLDYANEQRVEAERLLGEAKSARAVAEANFELAREAVDKTVEKVRSGDAFKGPRLRAARRDLLETSLGFYERFLAARADDPKLQLDMARAHSQRSTIMTDLETNETALEEARRAEQILVRLVAARPDDPEPRYELGLLSRNMGNLHRAMTCSEPARAAGERAVSLLEALVSEHPESRLYVRELGAAYNLLGNVEEDPQLALDWYTKYRTVLEESGPDPDALDDHESRLGTAYINLAYAESRLRRYAEAKDWCAKAVATLQAVVSRSPDARGAAFNLALAHRNLGSFFDEDSPSDPERTREEYEAALAINRQLVADDPDDLEYREGLAWSLRSTADALASGGDQEGALGRNREAIAEWEGVFQKDPTRMQRRAMFAWAQRGAAMALKALARGDEALVEVDRYLDVRRGLADASPEDPERLDDVARALHDRGGILSSMGRRDDAREAFLEGLRLREGMAQRWPDRDQYVPELGWAYYNVAIMSAADDDAAAAMSRMAVRTWESLLAKRPEDPEGLRGLGWSLDALEDRVPSDSVEATELRRRELAVWGRRIAAGSHDDETLQRHRWALSAVSSLLAGTPGALGDLRAQVDLLRTAASSDASVLPRFDDALDTYVDALTASGATDEAVALRRRHVAECRDVLSLEGSDNASGARAIHAYERCIAVLQSNGPSGEVVAMCQELGEVFDAQLRASPDVPEVRDRVVDAFEIAAAALQALPDDSARGAALNASRSWCEARIRSFLRDLRPGDVRRAIDLIECVAEKPAVAEEYIADGEWSLEPGQWIAVATACLYQGNHEAAQWAARHLAKDSDLARMLAGEPLASTDIGHEIRCVAISPDGSTAAAGCTQGHVHLWRPAAAADAARTLPVAEGEVWKVEWAAGGTRLVVELIDSVHVWDPDAGTELCRLPGEALSFALAPRSNRVALATAPQGATILELDGSQVGRLDTEGQLLRVGWALDETVLVALGEDRVVRTWSVESGEPRQSPEGRAITFVVSPDARRVAILQDDGLLIWDVATGAVDASIAYDEVDTVRIAWGEAHTMRIAWSADGRWIAVGRDGMLRLCGSADPETHLDIELPGAPRAIAFHPDGMHAVVALESGVLEYRLVDPGPLLWK